ncbi:MAG: LL-diaminopimelate aminotransferase [Rikenellaceae bacterium]
MILINSQFLKMLRNEVQEKTKKKINVFNTINPEAKLLRLDSGDVSLPLTPSVITALQTSVSEMGDGKTFHGRGPIQGYPFLIDSIIKNDFKSRKIKITADEVFINEGTKENVSSIGDILCGDNRVGIIDPVFQTFTYSNVISNRAGELSPEKKWDNIIYIEGDKSNNFIPELPSVRPDVIYLSYPNDPTGSVMSRSDLEKWVRYALRNDTLILFDATYEAFITEADVPHSIYEIKGARRVAIEFRSFSKSGGFTGLHCGYMVIPKDIIGYSFSAEQSVSLNALWHRRQTIKNNAPAYIIQRAAQALYTTQGRVEVQQNIDYYMKNAEILRTALSRKKLRFWGGVNAPFIWVESPYGSSWELFDKLLHECNIISAPGDRFGACGEGYVRLSAFANQSEIMMAASRIADTSF